MIRDHRETGCVEGLYREHFEKPVRRAESNGHSPPAVQASERSDAEVIEKARAERGGKFDRLWNGDTSDYGDDHSDADDGFVHKLWPYTQDEEQIRRIHAASGLHRTDKSGRRYEYLQYSIERARKNTGWFYEWDPPTLSANGNGRPSSERPAPPVQDQQGILLSEVVPERVRWLWDGRIALGKLNLVDGDPGTGKSAMTTDLAARVTVGEPWPDGAECHVGGVVILSAEDGLADTIRPRFDAAGGDASKAVAVSTVADAEGNERQIAIPDDLHVIEAAIERVGAVLVVIDPLMAFLPGDVNSHRDQDVRRALAPLARLAERTGAAVVVIRHLNKGAGGNALYRGGGSIGIVGAARSGLLIAKHPEDDGRRVLASIKSNLAAPAPSLVFGLSSTESGAVQVDWKGESDLDAAALLSAPADHEERSALSEAQEFLRKVLAEGPEPASEVKREADSAGISKRTLDRARQSLGVASEREGEPGKRGGGTWYWSLPGIKVANPEFGNLNGATDRTRSENAPYISQNGHARLSAPSEGGVKDAEDVGNLNRPLSHAVEPSSSATAAGLAASEQMRRAKSGPALALSSYLQKPNAERLEWLTKAVLTAQGMDTAHWQACAAAVKAAAEDPTNHPLGCECGAEVCG